mmetsp:Transcript_60666/g.144280  ORF Transcript_60666/g.144280 Transcript_60666/m.144280 type:complete len:424 (-) Transcript_60666:64-1335(-)
MRCNIQREDSVKSLCEVEPDFVAIGVGRERERPFGSRQLPAIGRDLDHESFAHRRNLLLRATPIAPETTAPSHGHESILDGHELKRFVERPGRSDAGRKDGREAAVAVPTVELESWLRGRTHHLGRVLGGRVGIALVRHQQLRGGHVRLPVVHSSGGGGHNRVGLVVADLHGGAVAPEDIVCRRLLHPPLERTDADRRDIRKELSEEVSEGLERERRVVRDRVPLVKVRDDKAGCRVQLVFGRSREQKPRLPRRHLEDEREGPASQHCLVVHHRCLVELHVAVREDGRVLEHLDVALVSFYSRELVQGVDELDVVRVQPPLGGVAEIEQLGQFRFELVGQGLRLALLRRIHGGPSKRQRAPPRRALCGALVEESRGRRPRAAERRGGRERKCHGDQGGQGQNTRQHRARALLRGSGWLLVEAP